MRITTTYSYSGRRPVLLQNLMPKLHIAPASTVLRWAPAEIAEFELSRTANNLACAEAKYANACAALGQANRARYGRRLAKAAAFRAINVARRQLREARAAAQAARTVVVA
jgi:hypothetical protein